MFMEISKGMHTESMKDINKEMSVEIILSKNYLINYPRVTKGTLQGII